MKGEFKADTVAEFQTKYEKHSAVGGVLIKNFFETLGDLIPEGVSRAVEIGCGSGFSTKKLKELLPKSASLEASDLQVDLVEEAKRQNPGVNITVQSIYGTSYPSNSFDLVCCLEVLEHLEDPKKALEELERISSVYLILSVPREPLWRVLNCARGAYLKDFGNTPGHLNHWSRKAFVSFLEDRFDTVSVRSPLPWTMVLVKKRNIS